MKRPKKHDGPRLAPVIPLAPRLIRKGITAVTTTASAADSLDLSEHSSNDYTAVAVRGEVDIMTAPRLHERLVAIVSDGAGDLLVDLSHTDFIDSTGLHVLLNTQRRLVRQSRRLYLICGEGPVRRTLELARLESTLGVLRSERDYPGRAAQ